MTRKVRAACPGFGLLLLVLVAKPSWAVDDLTLFAGLFTRHVNPADDTNEKNWLVGVGIDHWVAARYKNSYHNWTHFAGRRWQSSKLNFGGGDGGPFLQGSVYAGMIHGYKDRFPNIAGFTAGLAPALGIGYQRASLEVMYVPTDTGGVFTSYLTYRFGD